MTSRAMINALLCYAKRYLRHGSDRWTKQMSSGGSDGT